MREFAILPDEAFGVVTANREMLQRLLAMNIEAEKSRMAPSAIAEMVLSFFSGLCFERNLESGKASSTRKIEIFMTNLRSLWFKPIHHASNGSLASSAKSDRSVRLFCSISVDSCGFGVGDPGQA
jgi:hypothetical protein